MTPQTARRVARWHASQGHCTPFRRGGFGDGTWRQHFEWDRKRMFGRTWPHDSFQVEEIVRFLQRTA